jgi:hypothetical protein
LVSGQVEAAVAEIQATLAGSGWPAAVVEAATGYLRVAATAPPDRVARVPAWTAALAVARPAELGIAEEADLETLTIARFRHLQRLLEHGTWHDVAS